MVIECYDNGGKTKDRYLVRYPVGGGDWIHLLMSENPLSPRGVNIVTVRRKGPVTRMTRVGFWRLPYRVRRAVLMDLTETSKLLEEATREAAEVNRHLLKGDWNI